MYSRPAIFLLILALLVPRVAVAHTRALTGQPAPQKGAATRERQPPAPVQTAPAGAQVSPQTTFDAEETRQQLETLLRQYPPSVAEVLRIDPSMLTNEHYLATYPALDAYLAQHPEVGHNPAYFVGTEQARGWNENTPQMAAIRMWENTVQGFQIIAVVITVTAALIWVIRTLLDYRRWLRLSRVQTEVHTKLLDRFATNEDLLAYIQTPAGRRFLESAPIPLDSGPGRIVSAPVNRILWSVQVGVILSAGALGMMYISGRQIPEIGQPMSALGTVALAIGVGFVVSAFISYLLSRRLGLVSNGSATPPADLRGA
jgi:hypothetical protein